MIKSQSKTKPELYSHLMRRIGVGCTVNELENISKIPYESLVNQILSPEDPDSFQEDDFDRYFAHEGIDIWAGRWLYRIINGGHPLREKISIFWHQLFATAWFKSEHPNSLIHQLEMFRKIGLSDVTNILRSLSKDPAMLFWLDNNDNIDGEPNENYGRELIELFSMGVGNYTENDVKNAALAFTGWTFAQSPPLYPHGYYPCEFVFKEEDHDNSEKQFLGHTGNFDGGDVIDIIVDQPACAGFISRHLYNFFVADEPQVPTWNEVAPQDPHLIDAMSEAFMNSGGDIKSVLRVMFNSNAFKDARFKKVKSPIELVVGILKMVGNFDDFRPGLSAYADSTTVVMGQKLLDPPSVEGWHTGKEWIDGGNLTERVNFAVSEIGDGESPGVQQIIDRILDSGSVVAPEDFVDSALDAMGPITVEDSTSEALMKFARDSEGIDDRLRAVRIISLIVSTPEYQFA